MVGTSKDHGTAKERRKKYGSETHWKLVNGQWVPPELQYRYLQEWCMAWPRPYDTKAEWAAANNVAPRTLNNWENDERFTALWKRLADSRYTHPDFLNPIVMNMQRIVNAAWDDPDIKAADRIRASDTLWRIIEKMSPPRKFQEEPEMDQDLALIDETDLLEAAANPQSNTEDSDFDEDLEEGDESWLDESVE